MSNGAIRCNPNNPVVILRFAADRGRSIIRVRSDDVMRINTTKHEIKLK
jgi:hypothetical protein